jgi:hypothetical protein
MSILYHGGLTFASFGKVYSDNRAVLGVMCITFGGAEKIPPPEGEEIISN